MGVRDEERLGWNGWVKDHYAQRCVVVVVVVTHALSPLGNLVKRWISPFMPRQNSEEEEVEEEDKEDWLTAVAAALGTTPAVDPADDDDDDEEEEEEAADSPAGLTGQPFHGAGRWHAPAMCRPPWKMMRVGRMDFLNPR